MNKKFFLTLIIFTLTLTACASNSLPPAAGSNESSSAVALPMQSQLILGTLKLEGTDYAVTAEQAAELLPMWYVLQELTSSDTSAQEEIDGLVSQIQETMTTDQTQAITDMGLSPRDLMTAMQENGGTISNGSSPAPSRAAGGGAGGPPDMPAGGPPDMPAGGFSGGGMPGSGVPDMAPGGSTSSTDGSTTNRPAMNGTPSALFDVVIELLKTKIK